MVPNDGHNEIFKKAGELVTRLETEINGTDENLLKKFPVNRYIDYMDGYPYTAHYRYVGPNVSELCDVIIEMSGKKMMELYHQLLLVTLVAGAREKPGLLEIPADIRELFYLNFRRIMEPIESGRAKEGYYLYPGDKFCKDLGVCRLTMIPGGAEKVYVGRIPRKFLFTNGLRQFFRGLGFLLFETGGLKPVYRMHMDSKDRDLMKEFNPDGWLRFYKRMAQLLKMNTKIRGVCGGSWFFDPQLKEISPELGYLREIVLDGGGRFFRLGVSEGDTRDAAFMSPKRIRLYKEGKYTPVSYLMIFPREKLLKWSDERDDDGIV